AGVTCSFQVQTFRMESGPFACKLVPAGLAPAEPGFTTRELSAWVPSPPSLSQWNEGSCGRRSADPEVAEPRRSPLLIRTQQLANALVEDRERRGADARVTDEALGIDQENGGGSGNTPWPGQPPFRIHERWPTELFVFLNGEPLLHLVAEKN